MEATKLKRIGTNVRCALIKAGYNCLTFSKETGIAQSTLSKIVTGKGDARVSTLLKIANFLKIDIQELFEGL